MFISPSEPRFKVKRDHSMLRTKKPEIFFPGPFEKTPTTTVPSFSHSPFQFFLEQDVQFYNNVWFKLYLIKQPIAY